MKDFLVAIVAITVRPPKQIKPYYTYWISIWPSPATWKEKARLMATEV